MRPSTIVALSTPPGYSGLAIVRLSGPYCLQVLAQELKCPKVEDRRVKYGGFYHTKTKQKIDSLNYVYMKAPRTSTGEDVLEIFPHGNPLIIRQIIESLLNHKEVCLAEAGEFTRRSLENGKLDLIQAEAVGQIIHAQNEGALKNAQKLLNSELSKPLNELAEQLTHISIQLELDVDFVEEEAEPDYSSWELRIVGIKQKIESLCLTWERGKKLNKEIKIALYGKPNAGKSSLINAILNQDRLIVSQKAGTTRDYVEVSVNLEGGRVLFVDTAGVGQAIDEIDQAAMEKTRQILTEVDYRVSLVDGSAGDSDLLDSETGYDLQVYTKSDLPAFSKNTGALGVSSRTGEGVSELLKIINQAVFAESENKDEILISTERQYQCLTKSLHCVNRALTLLAENPAVELLAFELREARNHLAELIGEYQPDEVLNKLFSGFCIGK